ncbi:MAG: hypothetical protein CVV27_15845, partial [Candidatus Melainabacteria bacterium HGW-Melainabacteria-1]
LLSQYGFSWLDPDRGFALLETLLRDQAADATVMGLDLNQLLQALPQTRNLPLISPLARAQGLTLNPNPRPHPIPSRPAIASEPRPASPQARPGSGSDLDPIPARAELPTPAELETFVLQTVARILSVSPAELNTQTSLRGYGFDSLMALELKAQLQAAYGITLKASERQQSMSIGEICERILNPIDETDTASTEPVSEAM